jgi:hypothetical protein
LGLFFTDVPQQEADMGGMMPESIEPEDALKPFPQ